MKSQLRSWPILPMFVGGIVLAFPIAGRLHFAKKESRVDVAGVPIYRAYLDFNSALLDQ